jgi:hypothetical protein
MSERNCDCGHNIYCALCGGTGKLSKGAALALAALEAHYRGAAAGVMAAPAPNVRELALEACQALLMVHFDHMGNVCGDPERCWKAAKALYDAVNTDGVSALAGETPPEAA